MRNKIGEKRNAVGKRPCGRLGHGWRDNIEVNFKKRRGGCGVYLDVAE